MKKFRKLISILLLAGLLVQTAVSCSDSPSNTPSSDTSAQNTPASDAENPDESGTGYTPPNLPDKKFDGEKIRFITRDSSHNEWQTVDMIQHEQNGDVVNDAVYDRTIMIEEKYGITYEDCPVVDIQATATNSILANSDDFDVVNGTTAQCAAMSTSKYLMNLYDVPYINPSSPWWDQKLIDSVTMGGKLYYMTGDISIVANEATWIMMFNKQLIDDMGVESPYELVLDNRWTYDKMLEYMNLAAQDLNGNGKMEQAYDRFGFITTADHPRSMIYNAGEKFADFDSEGNLYASVNVERMTSIIDKSIAIYANKDLTLAGDFQVMQKTFEEGRTLFYAEVMQLAKRMRESTTDFGLIPCPKLDENQKDYVHYVHVTSSMISVPVTNLRQEMTGIILEDMGYISTSTLRPAYYEVALSHKYMRDADSIEMLDIILRTRTFDLAYIYDWGGIVTNASNMIINGKNNFASGYRALEKVLVKTMEKAMNKMLEE